MSNWGISVLFALSVLSGCISHNDAFTPRDKKYEGHYKVGSKYKINRITYKPKEVMDYDKTGLASWYGPGFYNRKTANGEIFTGRDFTAAHNTLPLPCIVRVVNLSNNKTVLVRINDRGPFHGLRRIIDLSEHAAEVLGIKDKGIGRVRIKFLSKETKLLHQKLGVTKIKR